MDFILHSDYKPQGDQPEAIEKLVKGFKRGNQFETLLGVTGSGKTFTMANIIERLQKPTLIISHNKTLAAQLYTEMKEFFPENAVEYFVSYYDYYQPEAYVPQSDTYIEKDSSINDEIDKLRNSAMASISERSDTIIVSSVSCIYGLGAPTEYLQNAISLRPSSEMQRDTLIRRLIDNQYQRNDTDFKRGSFTVKGDTVDIFPANESESAYRVEFFDTEIETIKKINALTKKTEALMDHIMIFPASPYVVAQDKLNLACQNILSELSERVDYFKENDRLLEAQRIFERTNYDVEMLKETGFCSGIENYTRHLNFQKPGDPPYTLIDYFPKDFLIIVDESHVSIPQIRGMYNGNLSRKNTLVDYGFRLPSALDNRPLNFSEFEQKIDQLLFVSATPGEYEESHELLRAEQVIRPTGLLDPMIEVRPTEGQIDDLINEINREKKKGGKVLVTTLTKRMAEDLTKYLEEAGIRVRYLHSDIEALERASIIRDMRLDKFDTLVGINLLREGLDIPEVSLVAILDADKEGFLRSETSLIQTSGRAARNQDGRVIMYADTVTLSMKRTIEETERRRAIQEEYNKLHNITPETIKKEVQDLISIEHKAEKEKGFSKDAESMSEKEKERLIRELEKKMKRAALELDFESAIRYRDRIEEVRS